MIDDRERLSFLTSLADKVNTPDSQDAYVYALADVADVKQRLQDLDGAKKDLDMCQRVLDAFDSVETVVHASFYKVNADYFHVSPPFYREKTNRRLTNVQSDQTRIRLFLQECPPLPRLHKPGGPARSRAGFPSI